MSPPISPSTPGRRSQTRAKSSARVSLNNHLKLITIELLEKSRHKRPQLEEVLNHAWFAEFKDIHKLR
jgi:hypothetical protein